MFQLIRKLAEQFSLQCLTAPWLPCRLSRVLGSNGR